jgi:hypothetical protein
MSINLLFDEEKREGIEQAWAEWWAGELCRPVVHITNPPKHPGANACTPRECTREFLLKTPWS